MSVTLLLPLLCGRMYCTTIHAYIQAHIGFPRDCRFVSGVRTHKLSTTDINEGTCNDYKGLIDAANLRGYDYWGHSNK